ncbi:MAG: PAS domain-containing protein, partial [Acidimicrobiales bacterium]
MGKVLHVTVLELVVTVVVVIVLITATALVTSRRGRTGLRQRLQALASRLGADAPQKDAHDFEEVLIQLERATDRATEAVAEASSEAIRLRRALDTLPQAVLVTDERGETVFRNSKAVALIGSR